MAQSSLSLTLDDVRAYLRDHHRAVLGTRRRDGGVQLSPVTVALDDDGTLLISTRETAVKTANVRRQPYASLCIFADEFFGPWVQVEGVAQVESLPDALEGLVRYYRLASGEHPDWDDYRAAMVRDRRVLLRVRPDRIGPTRSG